MNSTLLSEMQKMRKKFVSQKTEGAWEAQLDRMTEQDKKTSKIMVDLQVKAGLRSENTEVAENVAIELDGAISTGRVIAGNAAVGEEVKIELNDENGNKVHQVGKVVEVF